MMGCFPFVGVKPGTIVIADKAYDCQLKCQHQDVVLGKVRTTAATFDRELAEEILSLHTDASYDAIIGSTMGTQDFYEGMLLTELGTFHNFCHFHKCTEHMPFLDPSPKSVQENIDV